MKLLLDNAASAKVLTESTLEGGKRMYIAGPFLMHSKENRNGRVYSKKGMDEAVKRYTEEYIKTSRALGEMNHPVNRLQVDPERACIMTTELTPDGNYYYGKAKVLSTPLGKVLEALLCDDVSIGVSSRGIGTTTKRGSKTMVGDDFHLTAAADVVFDPSVGEAFVNHLMEEKEYLLIDGHYVEKDLFEAKAKIKRMSSSKLQEAKLAAFADFLQKIKCQ
jgi:Prohead core protein serine protease